jgi:hypothetical protein
MRDAGLSRSSSDNVTTPRSPSPGESISDRMNYAFMLCTYRAEGREKGPKLTPKMLVDGERARAVSRGRMHGSAERSCMTAVASSGVV